MICSYCKNDIGNHPVNILGSGEYVCSLECGGYLVIANKNFELRKKENIMYEILIKKTIIKEVPVGGEWHIIEERPYSESEMKDSAELYKAHIKDGSESLGIKHVYGSTPEKMVKREVVVEILKQTVVDLDLKTMIKAINGIK